MAIEGGGTVADCITDPFDETNGCNNSAGFLATRTSRTTLCTASATLFDGLCDNFGVAGAIDATRNTICTTDATSFHVDCNSGEQDTIDARSAFVITCSAENAERDVTGCDATITKESSLTIAQCSGNPYLANCDSHPSFATEKSTRTTLCTDSTKFFDDLCGVYDGIDNLRETHCTTPATSFDANCDGGNYTGLNERREGFASTCRTAPTTPGCEKPADGGSGTLTIAQCSNGLNGDPYQTLCLGLSGFDEEVAARAEDCAVVAVLETSRCDNAKMRNDCVVNPFGKDNRGCCRL